jgi:exopolysaccharide biosynthesis polyprenyl glycosylphosphotransferase
MSPGLVESRKDDMLFPSLYLLGDLISLMFSAMITYYIRFSSGWFPTPLGIPPLRVYILAAAVMSCCTVIVFYLRRHYRFQRRGGFRHDLGEVTTGFGISLALLLTFLFFWRGFSFSRSFVSSFAILALILLLLTKRLIAYRQGRSFMAGHRTLNIAIMGRSGMTAGVWNLFRDNNQFGYHALGMIEEGALPVTEEEPDDGSADDAVGESVIPLLGCSDDLEKIALEHQLDTVMITLPFSKYGRFVELSSRLSALNVNTFLVPDLIGLMTSRLHHFELEGIPFLAFRHVPLSGLGRVLKRSFDILASGLALLLLSPLMLLLALAVFIDDRRPIFYSQIRLGRDGRRFKIRKYRSMRRDAEKDGVGWSQAGDSRRTRLGGFLRASSLDELPQFWNVLVGDMSLVGPRPERPEYVDDFARSIPRYFERHRVRSGLTGWAQVNGLRGDTPIDERTRYDLFYVENWSLAFDLKILWLTVRTVLSRNNAY